MKKFHFPLDRVLSWRRTQLRLEQVKLEDMLSELAGIEGQAKALEQAVLSSRENLVRAKSSSGGEHEEYEAFREASVTQGAKLDQTRRACLERIGAQRGVIQQKEREVKLLEKLREDRLAAWRAAHARHIDQQAEEAYLARWTK